MRKIKLLYAELSLFNGAASTGGNGGQGTGSEVGVQTISGSDHRNAVDISDAAQLRSKVEAGGSNGDASDAGEQNVSGKLSDRERRAQFRRLVEGEYKDIYEKEFQSAFDRRFREMKELQERLNKQQPLIDSLMTRYNIESEDVEALISAIDSDAGYWESAADEAGMTIEQYKNILKLKSDSRRLAAIEEDKQRRENVRKRLELWNGMAKEVKTEYPEFDINAMAENKEFMSMLRSGVPMKHAYEVLNLTDIKAKAARAAAEAAEKNIVSGIRAKGARPTENGISSQNGITTGIDVSKLTREQRAEIAKKVQRGEVITFG